jgi:hypothetical protein
VAKGGNRTSGGNTTIASKGATTLDEIISIITKWWNENSAFPAQFMFWTAVLGILMLYFMLLSPGTLGTVLQVLVNRVLLRGAGKVQIGAVRLALMGGKVYIENTRYVTKDYCIAVHKGSVQLRWWRRTVARNHRERLQIGLPVRLELSLSGFEAFIFNQSAKVDALEALRRAMNLGGASSSAAAAGGPGGAGAAELRVPTNTKAKTPGSVTSGAKYRAAPVEGGGKRGGCCSRSGGGGGGGGAKKAVENTPGGGFNYFDFSPLTQIRINRGCIYAGSRALPTVLVTSFSKGVLFYQSLPIPDHSLNAKHDLYRVHWDANLTDVQVKRASSGSRQRSGRGIEVGG